MTVPSRSTSTATRAFGPRSPVILRLMLAALALGSQGIHLANMADQQRVWWGYGVFFLIVSAAQGILGVLLLFDGPTRPIAVAGLIGNGVIVCIWLVTRIGGAPGITTIEPLPIGDQALAAMLLGVSLMTCLAWSLLRSRRVDPTS